MVDFMGQPFETIKCPSCINYYQRMSMDNAQIVCPMCLNGKDEDDSTDKADTPYAAQARDSGQV